MTIHYSKNDQFIVVMGRTFQHRAMFQSLGAKFNYQEKTWQLPWSAEVLRQIDAICRAAGGGPVDEFKAKFEDATTASLTREPTESSLPSPPAVYSVGQLAQRISGVIEDAFHAPIWVSGELQNVNFRGQNIYVNLSEPKNAGDSATTTINAAIWQRDMQLMKKKYGEPIVKDILQEGMKLKMLCRVTFYKERGSITLSILDIDPEFTKGALALARQKLLQELRQLGLDRLNKNLPPPLYPFRIGLISAAGSRAYSDFVDQLHSKEFPGEIVFHQAAMQGLDSPEEVCKAMTALKAAKVDLIVITRGGGSSADLRWFDDPKICKTACHLGVPLIAAIGHHDDISVLETIVFQHEKTPTAAAEYILRLFERARNQLSECELNVGRHSSRVLQNFIDQLARRREQFLHATRVRLNNLQQSLTNQSNQIHLLALGLGHRHLQVLNTLEMQLIARDPRQWLEKGWVQLQANGKQINSITQLSADQEVKAHLLDGTASLIVQKTERRKPHDQTK